MCCSLCHINVSPALGAQPAKMNACEIVSKMWSATNKHLSLCSLEKHLMSTFEGAVRQPTRLIETYVNFQVYL